MYKIESIVKDERVFVDFEALLAHIFGVANTFAEMHHGPNKEEAAQRIMGIIDIGEGMETIHQRMKHLHDLT